MNVTIVQVTRSSRIQLFNLSLFRVSHVNTIVSMSVISTLDQWSLVGMQVKPIVNNRRKHPWDRRQIFRTSSSSPLKLVQRSHHPVFVVRRRTTITIVTRRNLDHYFLLNRTLLWFLISNLEHVKPRQFLVRRKRIATSTLPKRKNATTRRENQRRRARTNAGTFRLNVAHRRPLLPKREKYEGTTSSTNPTKFQLQHREHHPASLSSSFPPTYQGDKFPPSS